MKMLCHKCASLMRNNFILFQVTKTQKAKCDECKKNDFCTGYDIERNGRSVERHDPD